MKVIAGIVVFGIAASPLAWATPQQAADGIVTIRKKSSTWYFKSTPEGKKKTVLEGKEVETDVPHVLHVAYSVDEPYAAVRAHNVTPKNILSLFGPAESRITVSLYREGKSYAEFPEGNEPPLYQTRYEQSELQKTLLEQFYQFDLDFPGGTWEELARLLRDRLAAAYEQQFPEVLKPFLPAKIDLEVSQKPTNPARYPSIQAKSVTLALLRRFGPAPIVEGKTDSPPRVVEHPDKGIELLMDFTPSTKQLVMRDGNALESQEDLEVAFFHLGSKPSLPGPEDVVALFELAWKTRVGPLFAKVKYHPETKTLMVQGTEDEIRSADKVFATLTGQAQSVEPTTTNPFDALNHSLQKIAELLKKQTPEKDK